MSSLPESVIEIIKILAKTPAFSEKGAERFLEGWWKKSPVEKKIFLDQWTDFSQIGFCQKCFYFAKDNLCQFCQDGERDKQVLCLATSPFTVDLIEKNTGFGGNYFVLGGEVAGRQNVKNIKDLNTRLEHLKIIIGKDAVLELILATDFTSSGEATASFVKERVSQSYPDLKISRLGRGFHAGDMIGYSDPVTLKKALERRE